MCCILRNQRRDEAFWTVSSMDLKRPEAVFMLDNMGGFRCSFYPPLPPNLYSLSAPFAASVLPTRKVPEFYFLH